jgi:hypothetical protein
MKRDSACARDVRLEHVLFLSKEQADAKYQYNV